HLLPWRRSGMNPNGPFLSVATFCERVLHEKDEVLSCIRLVDTINVQLPADAPDPLPPTILEGTALVSFKSGEYVGPMTVRIESRNPSGKPSKPPQEYLVQFKGKEHGVNLILTVKLEVTKSGIYWLDILLGNEIATKMPLRVNVTRKTDVELKK